MAHAFSLRCAVFSRTCFWAVAGTLFSGSLWAQGSTKSYLECNHDSLVTVLRAYEDSLALAGSSPIVRANYAWSVTDGNAVGKAYFIYRCSALRDSITVLMNAVDFARATPPVVDTDSISGTTGTAAVFHAKVTSDGGQPVSAQWFRYGTIAGNLSDSAAVVATSTPFTAAISTLSPGTTYYVAGFARNAKGTASGDTLSFTTWSAPTVDTQAASSVLETAAVLNATFANGGNAVTATGFKYATNPTLASPTLVAGGGVSSPFNASLSGLVGGTQYWAVGFATNAVGTSYGDTVTFTTPVTFVCGTNSVTYDGHVYPTISIGTQCWFQENLRTTIYRNGDAIPAGLSNALWSAANSGAQTIYGEGGSNEAANLAAYGRLYNGYAVTDSRGVCPAGWHVSNDGDWSTLEAHVGGSSVAATELMSPSPIWNGTNSSGFSAVSGGFRDSNGGPSGVGVYNFIWTSTAGLGGIVTRVIYGAPDVSRQIFSANFGFSIRCIKD